MEQQVETRNFLAESTVCPVFFDQEKLAWQVRLHAPGDVGLFMSIILAYLMPVKNNDSEFIVRYEKLFGKNENTESKFSFVKSFIQTYDPTATVMNADENESLKELVELLTTQFQERIEQRHEVTRLTEGPDRYHAIASLLEVSIDIDTPVNGAAWYGKRSSPTIIFIINEKNHYGFLLDEMTSFDRSLCLPVG